jgi:hypothetical protein
MIEGGGRGRRRCGAARGGGRDAATSPVSGLMGGGEVRVVGLGQHQ